MRRQEGRWIEEEEEEEEREDCARCKCGFGKERREKSKKWLKVDKVRKMKKLV